MLSISIDDLVRCTGATLVAGSPEHMVHGCVIDSRQVGAGSLFVAFPGERVDGNSYVAQALAAGAACAVVTREPSAEAIDLARGGECAIVRAQDDDPEEFMLRLAAEWRRRHPDWLVCGVTGSVGKTTTKDMCARALGARYATHATKGNLNNLIGVPLTLLAAPDDAQALVVEMGMNHAGEISRLTAAVRPTVAVITNVGTSHIGNLGSRENIARAKAEVVGGMRPSAQTLGGVSPCLVLNGQDDFTDFIEQGFARPAGVDVVRVGGAHEAVWAQDVRLDAQGLPSFTICFADGWSREASLRVPGRQMATDCVYAMAIADRLHVDRDAALAAIEGMEAESMRLDVRCAPGRPRVIDDSYNASPASMAAALDVLASMECSGRRVAVLGEMGELGDEAPRLHGYVGAYAAATHVDLLVVVGGALAGQMAEAARTMGLGEDHVEAFPDAASALKVMGPVLGEDDLVLVKASRACGLDAFASGVLR